MKEPVGYRDKVLGGWLGKNIGGTLGGPWEGHTTPLFLHYYDPVPTEPLPNDDFELQLVWLDMLNHKGVFITPHDFVFHWRNRTLYLIAEYFMGQRNMALGILPPLSGAYNNWWINGMGATIRAEIWGMIAPGMPDIAAAYAYLDASTDHDQDGVYGEMFFAAMESAAFVETDPRKLIQTGLRCIAPHCKVAEAVHFVVRECDKGTPWRRIRHLICAEFAHPCDFTYVPVNVAFIVLGLLSGADYDHVLCNAVNCGYDTDCTGATVGALLGIAQGAVSVPERWLKPIGTRVAVSNYVPGIEYGETLEEVTDQVCALGRQVMAQADAVRRHLAEWTELEFLRPGAGGDVKLPGSTQVCRYGDDRFGFWVDYLDHPAVGHGEVKRIALTLVNHTEADTEIEIRVAAPAAWTLSLDGASFSRELVHRVVLSKGARERSKLLIKAASNARLNPSNRLDVSLSSEADWHVDTDIALVGKSCWLVSAPISADDAAAGSIEAVGRLTGVADGVEPRQLETDSLTGLVPGPGTVVFAETDFYVDQPMNVRVVANSTGPLHAYLNGKVIIDKGHDSPGILPTWHLQGLKTHLLPKDLGFANARLQKGWNTVMLRISGSAAVEDVNFHLVKIANDKPEAAQWTDYQLLTGVSNTNWRQET